MDVNSDMKKGSTSSNRQATNEALQPTASNTSKAAEAAGYPRNQPVMATIADDDDRLLARIGYTPV
jgi:hypothetical protein